MEVTSGLRERPFMQKVWEAEGYDLVRIKNRVYAVKREEAESNERLDG